MRCISSSIASAKTIALPATDTDHNWRNVMRAISRKLIAMLVGFAGFLALPALARAAGGIHDDGQFFSADTVRQGEQIIQHLRDSHKRDVLVQTYAQIPENLRGNFQSQGKDP